MRNGSACTRESKAAGAITTEEGLIMKILLDLGMAHGDRFNPDG